MRGAGKSSVQVAGYALFLGVGFLVASGCDLLQSLAGPVERPSARIDSVQLQALNVTSATLLFDVEVSNPYAVDLPLARLEYSIASRGKPFLAGRADAGGSVPAKSSRAIPVEARVAFPGLLKVLEGVKPGSVVPYAADLTLSLDVPGTGPLALLLRKEGELPVPAVPEVALEAVQWEGLSLEKATALMKLRVTNRNEFPLDLSKLSYGLTLGTARVAESSVEHAAAFAAGGENVIELRASFAPKDLGLAAFRVLSGDGASYKVGGTMNFKTAFGPLDLPYERAGETVFRR